MNSALISVTNDATDLVTIAVPATGDYVYLSGSTVIALAAVCGKAAVSSPSGLVSYDGQTVTVSAGSGRRTYEVDIIRFTAVADYLTAKRIEGVDLTKLAAAAMADYDAVTAVVYSMRSAA